MTFNMFDFDGDGFVSKEDVRLLLRHVSFKGQGKNRSRSSSPISQEGLYSDPEKDYHERVDEQDKIYVFVEKIFQQKESINFADYDKINREISSEMFYSVMFTLHEKLSCTQGFFKLKREFRSKHLDGH